MKKRNCKKFKMPSFFWIFFEIILAISKAIAYIFGFRTRGEFHDQITEIDDWLGGIIPTETEDGK